MTSLFGILVLFMPRVSVRDLDMVQTLAFQPHEHAQVSIDIEGIFRGLGPSDAWRGQAIAAREHAGDSRAGFIRGQDVDVEVFARDEGLIHGAGQRHVEHDVGPRSDAQGREGGGGDAARNGMSHFLDRHPGGGLGVVCSVEGRDDDGGVRELCHGCCYGAAEILESPGAVFAVGRRFEDARIFARGGRRFAAANLSGWRLDVFSGRVDLLLPTCCFRLALIPFAKRKRPLDVGGLSCLADAAPYHGARAGPAWRVRQGITWTCGRNCPPQATDAVHLSP